MAAESNGLPQWALASRAQIIEALTHLGFYAGWQKAAKAITVVTKSLDR